MVIIGVFLWLVCRNKNDKTDYSENAMEIEKIMVEKNNNEGIV